jgi:hypothetical protein
MSKLTANHLSSAARLSREHSARAPEPTSSASEQSRTQQTGGIELTAYNGRRTRLKIAPL